MSHIVERLREHEWGGTKPSIFSDAADEIETARAASRRRGAHGLPARPDRTLACGSAWAADAIRYQQASPARELVEAARAALKGQL